MKLVALIVLLLSLTITGFAQSDSGFTNHTEAKNEYNKAEIQNHKWIKEGKWVEITNANQDIAGDEIEHYLTIYKAGVPVGVIRGYYKDWQLASETAPYINGKKSGTSKWYYRNGKVYLECPMVDGKRNGVKKAYYKSGILQFEGAYVNGKREGVQKLYTESGKLVSEISFKNDQKNGEEISYDTNGVIREWAKWRSGECKDRKDYDEHGKEIKPDKNVICINRCIVYIELEEYCSQYEYDTEKHGSDY